MTAPRFTIGSRGSPLALAQAWMVAHALQQAHGWGPDSVAVQVVRTSGDRIQDRALAEVGGKALWTKELDLALLSGETHASVHSMKDVESERPAELTIAAMLERGDVRDRLIGAGSIAQLPDRARIGTASPRRAAQVRRLRPDLEIMLLRGNVETRLAKREAGEVDATLLAAAGLDRLGRHATGSAIEVDAMLPAPAQGAVGIECRSNDPTSHALLCAIDHRPTHDCVAVERAFTRALGGTCHSPVAALAVIDEARIWLRAELLAEDGSAWIRDETRIEIGDLETPAALARAMLRRAPDGIRRLFEPA